MIAIEITEPGDAKVLQGTHRPMPVCKQGQVLIKVHAAGINRPDIMQRKGMYPAPTGASNIPGLEVAGVVVEKAEDVSYPPIGERVCALLTGGGYAEYTVSDASMCLPIPGNYSFEQAAALPEALFTVWSNLFQIGHLQAGETVLIHGGSSGIGSFAIQLAKQFGARVYTTVGSNEKCQRVLELGADVAINYQTSDFVEQIQQHSLDTNQPGVDVILDIIGADYLQHNISCLRRNGRLLQIAVQQGPKTSINLLPLLLNNLSISGSVLRPRPLAEKAAIAQALQSQVWPLLEQGFVQAIIDSTFLLQHASQAHLRMESSLHVGKIVLTVNH